MNKNQWALRLVMAGCVSLPVNIVLASDDDTNRAEYFGNIRLGLIDAEDDLGDDTHGYALGGKLGVISPEWHGFKAGATVYVTQDIGDSDNGDFFDSDGDSYAILGEAYIQATFGQTIAKVGRFELDSPYADTDDIRMILNTFQGGYLSHQSLPDTTLYLGHLDKWAGVDAAVPEKFKDMNDDDGITFTGAVYEGFSNMALQAWFYRGQDFADLFYAEAMYETDQFDFGVQFTSQSDDTSNNSGPDGDAWGVFGSYSLGDVTLTAAWNEADGTVTTASAEVLSSLPRTITPLMGPRIRKPSLWARSSLALTG